MLRPIFTIFAALLLVAFLAACGAGDTGSFPDGAPNSSAAATGPVDASPGDGGIIVVVGDSGATSAPAPDASPVVPPAEAGADAAVDADDPDASDLDAASAPDDGVEASTLPEAGVDAATVDAAVVDTGVADTGAADTGVEDCAVVDTGIAPPVDAGVRCAVGQVLCDGVCTDTSSSSTNCGACGQSCSFGETCQNGSCACPSGDTLCGSACTDTTSDGDNCGTCGHACTGGETCQAGTCSCTGGETFCESACTSTASDSDNCGTCGHACTGGETCQGGACACTGGETFCGSACTSTASDNSNCGACGHTCTGGETCESGVCTCPTGQTFCSPACTTLATDGNNCGACGDKCTGGETCQSGVCACPSGQTLCDGTCVTESDDANNCGACGHSCLGGACSGGQCQPITLTTWAGMVSITLDADNVYVATGAGLYTCPKTGCPSPTQLLPTIYGYILYEPEYSFIYASVFGQNIVDEDVTSGGLNYAASVSSPGFITMDTHSLYVSTTNSIIAADKGPGAFSSQRGIVMGLPDEVEGMAVDPSADFIYGAVLGFPGSIIRGSTYGTGAYVTYAASQMTPVSVAVASGNVYWANQGRAADDFSDGGAYMCATGASCAAPQPLLNGGECWSVVTDSTNVYFDCGTALYRCSLSGCGGSGPVILAHSAFDYSLAMDATAIYWVAGNSLMKLAK